MVVAARAGKGRAEEGGRRRPDDVVQFVGPLVGGEDRDQATSRLSKGPATRKPVAASDTELVARELLADEPIVRHVGVEALG